MKGRILAKRAEKSRRWDRGGGLTLRSWEKPSGPAAGRMSSDVIIDMGWGRLILGHTFLSEQKLADALCEEKPGQRDIAFYLRDPHVVLSLAPQRLFLDPSHTYRLLRHSYRPRARPFRGFLVRRLRSIRDAEETNRIYAERGMVTCDPEFLLSKHTLKSRTYLIAESEHDGRVVGTVTGLDHLEAFQDSEGGASLWCLAVDPQGDLPGVGEALVRHLVEHYFARGRNYVDLSVLHDNREAIRLYRKLGFQRVPVFCIKHKNPINEPLFVPKRADEKLNPYARIIVKEARRRGIDVEVIDGESGYFVLRMGGRAVTCRESLTDLTSAIAMSRCDDKRLTIRVLRSAGLSVPAQRPAADPETNAKFVEDHGRVVVKPARGEQGMGVSVDLHYLAEVEEAVAAAKEIHPEVILEEYVEGEDLRVIVIDDEVVAAAIRRPPRIVGTGQHTVRELIEKANRRRAAATGGESRTPLDRETARCVSAAGYEMDSVLPEGESVTVRKTANLHTGGTIHDVTPRLHPHLARAATAAARELQIPVVGLDLIVPDVAGPDYVIVEANERPGLANHEPQPTAERFIDFLFPQIATAGS